MTLAYSLFAILRHWHFQSSFDLAIFDQAVWHYSRFETPANTISGHAHILAEHFHPILVVLAPLYWVLPRPELLVTAQAFLLSLSAVPVYVLARERLGPGLGLAMSTAYILFWGIQKAAAFDFHELAFAPVLIATALLGIETRRDRLFWPAAVSLLFVKEELPGVVVFLGFLLMLKGRWFKGLIVSAIGLAAFALIVGWLMPALGGSDHYAFASAYGDLGKGPGSAAGAMVTRPLHALAGLFSPPTKIRTLALWLGPFLFLPVLSPLALPAIPLVLARFLSSSPNHWMAAFHYSAPLAPILAMSAIDALSRLLHRIPDEARRCTAARWAVTLMVPLCAILPGNLPVWRLFSAAYYRSSETERTARRALALVPPAAIVVAQDSLTPHLSQRQSIYTLRSGAPEADFVLAGRALSPWPNENWGVIEGLLAERRARGYRTVFEENGFVVLEAEQPARRTTPGGQEGR